MPRAFAKREAHRKALSTHFFVLVVGVLCAFGINRFTTPERFWAHWVAIAWAAAFGVHLAIFAKGTLSTMGGKKPGA